MRRVGGTQEIPVQTRILAATHRNLSQLVQEGAFREDLFHRLVVLSIEIPQLSERIADVVPLARHFLADQSRDLTLTDAAEARLHEHDWPGNVRELRNVILRAALLNDGDSIRPEDLTFSDKAFGSDTAARRIRDLDSEERIRMAEAILRAGGNRAQAARDLGVSKSTFHDRLKRLGIGPKFDR